jgi:spore maturation protein CgeB
VPSHAAADRKSHGPECYDAVRLRGWLGIVKILYHGHMWTGSTARHRFEAFQRQSGITAIASPVNGELGRRLDLLSRARWKLGWPPDLEGANAKLLADVTAFQPDVVFIDNSRVITRGVLRDIRRYCDPLLVYYSPDDAIAPHNLTWPLRLTFAEWDLFFTTKTFNVAELRARDVRLPSLIGNSFDPAMHRPMTCEEVGQDFERYDLVFVGTVEEERMRGILKLAEAGFTIAVYGNPASRRGANWEGLRHSRIFAGPPAFGFDYARKLHHGKVALCFLRKINRDLITTRSVETPAMGRAMLAEKTEEHDRHFEDGLEYLGFSDESELLAGAAALVANPARRAEMGRRALARCWSSGYSTDGRAAEMVKLIEACRFGQGLRE